MKNQQRFKKIGLLSLLLLSITTFAHAQLWTQQTVPTLALRDPIDNPKGFGSSVSLSADGNLALVGASLTRVGVDNSFQGKAYFYKRIGSNWVQMQALKDKNGKYLDKLGYSTHLSADGKVAIVGSLYCDAPNFDQGAAFVYTLTSADTMIARVRISASDGRSNDRFSESISASADGSTIIVGAPQKSFFESGSFSPRRGKCYIFNRIDTTWVERQSIYPANDVQGYTFGYSVSLSADGNTALIGAPDARDANNNLQGRAYIFTRNSNGLFTEQLSLPITDSVKYGSIGLNVSLSADGNTAAVYGWGIKPGTTRAQGKIYVFTRAGNTWQLQSRLSATDEEEFDGFGESKALSISGDGRTIVVGAYNKNMVAINGSFGKVYIYARVGNGWVEQSTVFARNSANVGSFGKALSLSFDGNTALMGAEDSSEPGQTFVFIRNPNATTETNKKSNITLYPSTVKDELYIKTDALTPIVEVQIANAVGQIVYVQKNLTGNALNLQGLPSGLYVVSVRDTEGGIATGKIIKN